jgi:predicted nucleotidyltransferase
VATPRSDELRALAQRIADGLPAEEVALTGSVSRGVADEVSDIEMLVVTAEHLSLEQCFEHVRAVGLTGLDTWGNPSTPTRRVFGYLEDVPIETIWWYREYADEQIAAPSQATGDALLNAVPLKTVGLLAQWQERLRDYPDELVSARCEEAAERWGGYAPAGLLTIVRPGDRLQLVEWIVDAATRVLAIVYAVNRTWQPTSKRLAARLDALPVKPDRLAERIEEALTEPDPRRALIVMTQLQLDTVALAPSGPNVDRARVWLTEALAILQR